MKSLLRLCQSEHTNKKMNFADVLQIIVLQHKYGATELKVVN